MAVGNQLRLYSFFLDGDGGTVKPSILIKQSMLEAFRPVLNHQIEVGNKFYKVQRIEPPDNPTGRNNSYFVVEVGTPSAGLRFTGFTDFGSRIGL